MLRPIPLPVKPRRSIQLPEEDRAALCTSLADAPRTCAICQELMYFDPSPDLGAREPGHVHTGQGLVTAHTSDICEWCFEALYLAEGH